MKKNINLDDEGFPRAYEFIIPVLRFLKDGDYSEDEISNKLIEYFDLNEEQINQKVKPKNESNSEPDTKLKSKTHFAILDFERYGCIKKENKIYSIECKGEQILHTGTKKLKKQDLEKMVKKLDLIGVLGVLSNLELDVSSIYLTDNHFNRFIDGLSEHFKTFVKRNGINDFENQAGGVENRKTFKISTFIDNEKIECTLSLYRTTRNGVRQEPRINFIKNNSRRLWNTLKPGLHLFTLVNGELYFLNLSDNQTLKSLLCQKEEPYETLKKESYKNFNEKVKSFLEHLTKLNDKGYTLLNSEYPNIDSILKKEGYGCPNSHKYEYDQIEFEVLNVKNALFDKKSDNTLFNLIVNGDEYFVKKYDMQYFANNPYLKLDNINSVRNLNLEIDYERGLLRIIEEDCYDVLCLDLENILYNIKEKFSLIYKNIITKYGDEYVIFEKIFSYSKPNFGLLCFLMMDDLFKNQYDINIQLILETEFKDNQLNCCLRLESEDEKILKTLLYPNVFNLKDKFKNF